PLRLAHAKKLVAMLGRKRLPYRLQIVAGIEPFRYVADLLAERLAIAQEGGTREHVDLSAGVVDVVFARHLMAREIQERRQRVTEHRATAMTDMHRARGIGRN